MKSRKIIWVEHVACIGERRGVYRVLVRKPDGRIRHRWKYNIKMIFRKWEVGTWTGLIRLRIGTDGGHL